MLDKVILVCSLQKVRAEQLARLKETHQSKQILLLIE